MASSPSSLTRASRVLAPGGWLAAADTIALDYDGRRQRRRVLTAAGGLAFLLDLPRSTLLRDGDGLVLEDGRVVVVRAAAEALTEARAQSPEALTRAAWHLGNRHLPVEVRADALRLRPDPVIEDLLARLGLALRPIMAAFEPEGGAYQGAQAHDA